jgi:hypothetical protein
VNLPRKGVNPPRKGVNPPRKGVGPKRKGVGPKRKGVNLPRKRVGPEQKSVTPPTKPLTQTVGIEMASDCYRLPGMKHGVQHKLWQCLKTRGIVSGTSDTCVSYVRPWLATQAISLSIASI